MRNKLTISDDEPLSVVVDMFLRRYWSPEVEDKYLLALKDIRDAANPVIHLTAYNKEEGKEMWVHLSHGMNEEERVMYEQLMSFGKGDSSIFKRN